MSRVAVAAAVDVVYAPNFPVFKIIKIINSLVNSFMAFAMFRK